MGARLFFLLGWLREGHGFLRGARRHGGADAVPHARAISLSERAGVPRGRKAHRLPAGIQHAERGEPGGIEIPVHVSRLAAALIYFLPAAAFGARASGVGRVINATSSL